MAVVTDDTIKEILRKIAPSESGLEIGFEILVEIQDGALDPYVISIHSLRIGT